MKFRGFAKTNQGKSEDREQAALVAVPLGVQASPRRLPVQRGAHRVVPTEVAEIVRHYSACNSCTYTSLAHPNAALALLEVPKHPF